MTLELTRWHAILGGVLFVVQFGGLWTTIARSPDLHRFMGHVGSAELASWLIPLCAGSAFLTTVIIFQLLSVFTKPR
jgi:hypothetical protein